jgi:guanylate kinase
MLDNVPRTLKVDNLDKIKAALDELKGTVESMGEYEKDALQEQIGKVQHEFQVQQDTNYVINDELSKQKASLEAGF